MEYVPLNALPLWLYLMVRLMLLMRTLLLLLLLLLLLGTDVSGCCVSNVGCDVAE
jgi:hypothetical protein